MEKYFRFEDALPAWRERARAVLSPGAPKGEIGADPARVARACLDWLAAEGCWTNAASDRGRVEAEVEVALRQLAAPRRDAAAGGDILPSAWAIPAAAGSAIGAAILAPLTGDLFDSKPMGLFLGGVLGAYLVVRGMAAVLRRPRLAAAGPVAFLLPRRTAPGVGRIGADAGDISRAVDLALAVCWAHPDRLSTRAAEAPRGEPAQLPGPVRAELSRLWSDVMGGGGTGGAPDAELRDACEELFQRFGEDGYEWKSVAPGTPYAEEMAEAFDAFGSIAPGQPVRARRAAMYWRGRAIHKGELLRA